MTNRRTARKTFAPLLGNVFIVGLVIVILFKSIAGSTATDGSTPLALTPGAPAGSYPLSDLDNMNLYNGTINFTLPLFGIGGRGGAGYTITRTIEQHWRVDHVTLTDGRQLNIPVYNPWTPVNPDYGPGVLYGRQVSDGGCTEGYPGASTLTRLTFVGPDGTEHQLLDKLTMGQPGDSLCWAGPGFSRGTVFVSTNGTAMTFVSDSPIIDNQYGGTTVYATGYLMTADGTRFRIVNGQTQWLRDRNGNQVSITYPISNRMIATDQLGRQVIIDKNVSDIAPYGLCDKFTFNGFNGTQRFLRVSKRTLGNALHTGSSLQTPATLYPQLDGSSSTYHDPQVVSAVWLPDGRSYQFRYNSYGELARVELPTGGAFEYDYAAGLGSGAASGFFYTPLYGHSEIYRRSTEKRVYREGGILEHKTTTSRTDNLSANDTTVTVDKLSSTAALLTRSKHYFFGNPAKSFDLERFEYPKWKHGLEYKTEVFNTDGTTVLRRVEQTWQQPAAGYAWPLWQPETNDSAKANDPHITQTRMTLEPSTANEVSMRLFAYDLFSNKTDVWEYGIGVGGPAGAMRHTQTSFLITNPVNSLDYASPNPTASSIHIRNLPQNARVYTYASQEILVSETEYVYDETALSPWYGSVTQWADPGGARGNATKIRTWLNPGNTWLESRFQFDQVGNVSKSWDAKNNLTEIAYSATYHFAFPTQTTSPIPDPTGQTGSATALVTTTVYDLSTGLATSTTDANNQTTNVSFDDALNRPTQVIRAVGTSAQSQTTFSYDDNNRTITTTSDLYVSNDNVVKTQTVYDGLARTVETRQYEGGTNYIASQTQYDALGRPFKISNPFRPWQSETAVWTTRAFDALGRVTSVTTPDNAAVTSSYSGTATTVTDQAGKRRKMVTDALGHLSSVYEDPEVPGGPAELNYQTNYTYDAHGNLIKVTQGSQQRFFMYDSLTRLIRVRNPEQGTLASLNLSDPLTGNSTWSIGYQYDANGNLTQKTDPRGTTGIVSTHVYDALNRNTTIDYSDTSSISPDVKRFYDGAIKGKGRFWFHYSGGDFSTGNNVEHTAIDSYDALGRPLVQRQLFKLNGTWSSTYQISRAYNAGGNVTSQTYPSGHSVTYNYDTAGRLGDKDATDLAFTGNLGDGVERTYASGNTYNSWGSLFMEKFGTQTPLYHKLQYNIRGQLWDVRVATGSDVNGSWNRGALQFFYESTLTHGASGPDNNGNVLKSSHYVPLDDQSSTWAIPHQLYTYDSLNRLASVAEYFISNTQPVTQTSLQSYSYDRWGNRTINAAQTWGTGINNKQFTVDVTTNRLGVPGGQSGVMSYDNAGNLTTDSYTGAGTRTYDAENRMTTAVDSTNQTSRYTYDADGKRTRQQVAGSREQWQIYGFDRELLAEYRATSPASSPEKEYGYRNGQLLVTATGRINVALAANGAIATASSAHTCCGFSTNGAINGNNRGPWGNGEGWNDATENQVPDWIQVDFAGSKTIDEISVFSLHDNYTQENTPTETQTFTLYGLLAFDVQYWNGSTWVTIPGGNITGNNKVWRKFTFSPITTNKIRVFINTVPDAWSRVVEIQAFGTSPSGEKVRWLVPDHLGTPRIVIDETGSLAGVKRHDYLPFGEELFAGTGGRTTAMGYAGDGVRQQFTSKERDIETGLDYFLARYYSAVQGRFTGVDPENYQAMLDLSDPQSWNGYSYVNNNPPARTDDDGRGFFKKLWNKIRWGVWGEDADVEAEEKRRRQFLYDNSFTKDAEGNWQHVDFSHLSRDDLWVAYEAWHDRAADPNTYRLTAEEIANALPAGAAPSTGSTGNRGTPAGNRSRTPSGGLEIDATGKVHGKLPKSVPKQWTREQLQDSASALRQSIANRKAELRRLGEHGPHRARIGQEERLLRQIEKKLSGS